MTSSRHAYIFFLGVSTTLVILHCIHRLSFLLWLGSLIGDFGSYVELAGLLSRRTFAAFGAFLQFDDRRAFTLSKLVEENGPTSVWYSCLIGFGLIPRVEGTDPLHTLLVPLIRAAGSTTLGEGIGASESAELSDVRL